MSDKLHIAVNDSLLCQKVYSTEDNLAWAQINVASCLWRCSLAFYIFIKDSGVKMPAYMTAGVVATVACVCSCTTHLKHTLLKGAGSLEACQKLWFKTGCLSVKAHLSSGCGVYNTLYFKLSSSHLPRYPKKLGWKNILMQLWLAKYQQPHLTLHTTLGTDWGRRS